jgi:hypothetical protein
MNIFCKQEKIDDSTTNTPILLPLPPSPIQLNSTLSKELLQSVGRSQRRNYKFLADMPAEDWGMPDVCLQKTAEVLIT